MRSIRKNTEGGLGRRRSNVVVAANETMSFPGLPDFDNDLRRFIGRKMPFLTVRTTHVNNHGVTLPP